MNACDPTKPHPDAMTPDAPKQRNRTVAVVVTYHPDTDRLMESLRSILPQVHSVIVVDNGSPETALESIATLDRVIVERLETNCGIAFAQNRGFALAKQINAGFVLLLDQDSVASTDMVMRLQAVFDVLAARGARLAAIGPAQLDGLNAGAPRFTRFRRGRYMQIQAAPETTSVACDMLIASGTLIPIEVFDVVGAMNEGLFIDKVDTDWCIRAQRAGYSIHGVPGAALFHRLGESVLTVGWWRGKRGRWG